MARGKAAGAAAKAPSSAAECPEPEPVAISWTRGDDKLLEMLLFCHLPRWDLIASRLLGNKTPEQASQRYERTVHEVTQTLHGLHVETPRAWDDDKHVVVAAAAPATDGEYAAELVPPTTAPTDVAAAVASSAGEEAAAAIIVEKADLAPAAEDGEASERVAKISMRKGKRERKKPMAWTQQEHNLFLAGLQKYGKGKWKVMASEYLKTKSASQIASHHQKHRNRWEQRKRNACKRASIHDITQPTTAASVAEPPAAQKDELGRGIVESKAPGEDERGPAADGGEHTSVGGDDLVGALEEFPGEDDPGTLFTY
ncbi:hypothetical protein EJB05_21561, partial [Eragrostis curvula]